MTLDDIKAQIRDLVSVEPKSLASDRQAAEAASWLSLQKEAESDINLLYDPEIKNAFAVHKKLIATKKGILDSLDAARNRVRYHLSNWIAAGNDVTGCYTKVTYKVTVTDAKAVPEEWCYLAVDEDRIKEWAKMTEGKQPVPGCVIEPVHTLYFREER